MPYAVTPLIAPDPRREAGLFAAYLVNDLVPAELIERYVSASRILFDGQSFAAAECAVVAFALRHSWSLGFLDAASGFVAPNSLLRSKLLVFVAILEASPYFTDQFMPRAVNPVLLLWKLTQAGLTIIPKLLIGLSLLPIARRGVA